MQLIQLGDQYLRQADALLERIHRLNRQLKTVSGNDRIVMKRRILSLYIDAAECRRCAEFLKNYRKGVNTDEQNDL